MRYNRVLFRSVELIFIDIKIGTELCCKVVIIDLVINRIIDKSLSVLYDSGITTYILKLEV